MHRSNHPLAVLMAATLLVPAALAQGRQQRSQEELIALRAEKLAKPVFDNAAWHFDYDEARAKAKQEGKLILTYFTRSFAA